MDDKAFRRERLLASGLLREVSPDEAARLVRFMEARAAEAMPAVLRAETAARPASAALAQ